MQEAADRATNRPRGPELRGRPWEQRATGSGRVRGGQARMGSTLRVGDDGEREGRGASRSGLGSQAGGRPSPGWHAKAQRQ